MEKQISNLELANEYKKNPRKGIDLIYQNFADKLIQYAVHSFKLSLEQAEDAVHEALLPWVIDSDKMMEIENISAYLYASLRHACFRIRKQSQTKQAFVEIESETTTDPHLAFDVEQALKILPEEQREAVFLKIWGELSFEEIATIQNVSLQTTASRYRYALGKLKEILQWNP